MTSKIVRFSAGSFLACFALFVVIAGCKKSNSSSTGGGTLSATLTPGNVATGFAFQPSLTVGTLSQSVSTIFITSLQIKSGDSLLLQVGFVDTARVNVAYPISGGLTGMNYSDALTGFFYIADQSAGSGSVTLTTIDTVGHKAVGTFSGTMVGNNGLNNDTLIVTNGQFNSTYTVGP